MMENSQLDKWSNYMMLDKPAPTALFLNLMVIFALLVLGGSMTFIPTIGPVIGFIFLAIAAFYGIAFLINLYRSAYWVGKVVEVPTSRLSPVQELGAFLLIGIAFLLINTGLLMATASPYIIAVAPLLALFVVAVYYFLVSE